MGVIEKVYLRLKNDNDIQVHIHQIKMPKGAGYGKKMIIKSSFSKMLK